MARNVDISNIVRENTRHVGRDVVADAKYFFFETKATTKTPLAIVCGGYEKCGPAFDIHRTDYPFHVVKYTIKGKGLLRIHGKEHILESGVLSSFSPGVEHEYQTDTADPMEHIFVTFIGKDSESLLKKSTLASEGIMHVSDPEGTISLFEAILNKGIEKNEYAEQLCVNYLRILLLEQACAVARTGVKHSLARQSYWKCRKYIDENFSWLYSVGQVADASNINVRYMSRLFKKYSYITPHQYLTRLKMNKAVNLLLNSQLTVAQVGREVGFEDPYHFSRVFRKHQGASPRNYRQRHM